MCREKTAFLVLMERTENKCKHITSKCTHQWFKRNKSCEQKTVNIIWWYAENCQVYNTVLTLTLTTYSNVNTIFAPVHRPVFNTVYILIATQNIINSFIP
jgi:hypothetical protein